jgi:hypothetical protein
MGSTSPATIYLVADHPNEIKALNVADRRARDDPGVGQFAKNTLKKAFRG